MKHRNLNLHYQMCKIMKKQQQIWAGISRKQSYNISVDFPKLKLLIGGLFFWSIYIKNNSDYSVAHNLIPHLYMSLDPTSGWRDSELESTSIEQIFINHRCDCMWTAMQNFATLKDQNFLEKLTGSFCVFQFIDRNFNKIAFLCCVKQIRPNTEWIFILSIFKLVKISPVIVTNFSICFLVICPSVHLPGVCLPSWASHAET